MRAGEGSLEEGGGGQQKMGWLDVINTMDMGLSKFWEIVKDRETWGAPIHGITKNQTQLSI